MTNVSNSPIELDLRMLRVGGMLAGAGMLLASVGTAVVGVTMARAARDWMRQLERPPGAIAADKYHQARDASNAAMQAWRSARPVNGAVTR
jgi:hypothetical protein